VEASYLIVRARERESISHALSVAAFEERSSRHHRLGRHELALAGALTAFLKRFLESPPGLTAEKSLKKSEGSGADLRARANPASIAAASTMLRLAFGRRNYLPPPGQEPPTDESAE
jgi:hypothetical protein